MSYIDCHICITLNKETRAADDSFLCEACITKLRDLLQDIAELHDVVSDAEFLASTRDKTHQDWMGSKAPCDPYVISLTDRRSRYTHKGDAVSAARVLGAWVQAVSDNVGHVYSDAETVQGYASYLVVFLPWIVRQPAVERFARHVSATYGALRRVVPGDAA